MKIMRKVFLTLFIILSARPLFAVSYSLPAANEGLIGTVQYTTVAPNDTLITVGERYDIGRNAIENANPQYDFKEAFPINAPLQISTAHLLPNQARRGIVVNLPEMRIYYYLPENNEVHTYPIGIGKIGKTIPIRNALITYKKENPSWTPPADIRDFNLAQGILLPKVMPPGPDNPLGPYAIYMSIPTFLMHSTIFPESVGKRASFGCLRMYQKDIASLFPLMKKGIPITIINSPIKTGWKNEDLYVEAHQPLEEHAAAYDASLPGLVSAVIATTENQPTFVDWQAISYIAKERDGIPHAIGFRIPNAT